MSAASVGPIGSPVPALIVRNWSPLAVTSGLSDPAPYHARPIAAAMMMRNASHNATARPVLAGRWAASATDTFGCAASLAGRAFALGALALELAGAADCCGALTRPLFRRLLVMTAQLHLAVDALALQLFLERAQRLLDIIVANDDLHKYPSNSFKISTLRPTYTDTRVWPHFISNRIAASRDVSPRRRAAFSRARHTVQPVTNR